MQTNIDDLKPGGRPAGRLHLSIASRALDVVTLPTVAPLVSVVDGDASVRSSLELLIRSQGWKPKHFHRRRISCRVRASWRPAACCWISRLQSSAASNCRGGSPVEADIPIVFITGSRRCADDGAGDESGCVRFLTKPLDHDALVPVIRHALERSRAILQHESAMQALRSRYASLTPRERDVMALVVSGLLNKQVGGELGISEITVKAHRGQVMRKMKADSLASLVTMAARIGLRSVAPTH